MEGALCHDGAGIDEPGEDVAAAVPCCFSAPGWTYKAERVQGPEQMWLVRLLCAVQREVWPSEGGGQLLEGERAMKGWGRGCADLLWVLVPINPISLPCADSSPSSSSTPVSGCSSPNDSLPAEHGALPAASGMAHEVSSNGLGAQRSCGLGLPDPRVWCPDLPLPS